MGKKRTVDKLKYGWKPIHNVNGIPWPRINESSEITINVPLKKEYLLRSMDYLDTPAARPIFETQVEFLIKNKCSGIIDIGCRTGTVNDILQERGYQDYRYMGFDTSPEPIAYSNEVWSEFDNIEYRWASWDDTEAIKVDFRVDCVIWSGVLLYRPNDHLEFFERLTKDFYKSERAIIQEPMPQQKHWIKTLQLNTIADQLVAYKEKFSHTEEVIVDLDIFSGRRIIMDVLL